MIEDIEKGLSDFFEREVKITWIVQPWEGHGVSVDGFYRIEVEGKHMDVGKYTLESMIPPYNDTLVEYLGSLKRKLDKQGEHEKKKGHRGRPSFLRMFKFRGLA